MKKLFTLLLAGMMTLTMGVGCSPKTEPSSAPVTSEETQKPEEQKSEEAATPAEEKP
nr:hypothetical protein [uncultured Niameybacter sp.]